MIEEYDLGKDRHVCNVVKTNLDNDTLEYAAKWIENSLVGESNERVIEFGKNMAMSIRAAKIYVADKG